MLNLPKRKPKIKMLSSLFCGCCYTSVVSVTLSVEWMDNIAKRGTNLSKYHGSHIVEENCKFLSQ